MIEYFNSLVEYINEQKKVDFANIEIITLRQTINDYIEQINIDSQGVDASKIDSAKFAVACWIDEAVQRSNWPEKSQWQQQLLQEQYFNTSNGGEIFFTNINSFTDKDAEIVRVYYRCLILGFRGKYYSNDASLQLNNIKKHCLKLMGLQMDNNLQQQICPELYASLDHKPIQPIKSTTISWYKNNTIKWLLPVIILILVFLFFYGILHFTISNYIDLII
jgi:type VI secretion system protein ImpK